MSQLKTNSITNIGNTGDANIVLGANGDTQVQSLNSGPLAGFRNQIINGDFRIWQRGTSIATTALSNYTADRWRVNGGVTGNVTQGTVNFKGNSYALEATYTAVSTGGMSQLIELPKAGAAGPFYGTWTCSWWSNSSNFAPLLRFNDDFINGAWTSAGTFSSPQVMETIGAWSRYSATITITGSPATKDTFLALTLENQTAETVSFTGVQLEPGPVATPFEHRPIGTELALCQRYYLRYTATASGQRLGSGMINSTTSAYMCIPMPTTMRTSPIPTFNALDLRDPDFRTISGIAVQGSFPGSVTLSVDIVGANTGNACHIRFANETSSHLSFSAEL